MKRHTRLTLIHCNPEPAPKTGNDPASQLIDPTSQMQADIALGFAEQCLCETREDLIEYARRNGLVNHLRFFLERRNRLDLEWWLWLDALDKTDQPREV
ncbi:hypothetical protein TspCOW1_13020 [Thiohalobacter sp. COW1]|uniref:hypothetical protein n=1 Tax=Thiohalobacter sp. COW1 TaxID=2795687 RepID=UPI001915A4BE|nr:hypothetical protein [Thiohalobacter sp. COW1]BCO31199.1 hypothetical protein TspCOW1_13020 [Thiohalobacter sp. COW1]